MLYYTFIYYVILVLSYNIYNIECTSSINTHIQFIPSLSNLYQYIKSSYLLTILESKIENINYYYSTNTNTNINTANKFQLIAMPLTNKFKIPNLDQNNDNNTNSDKLSYGDACILPYIVGKSLINKQSYPYILQIKKSNSASSGSSSNPNSNSKSIYTNIIDISYISILNFHAPANYIYIPQWLMDSMGIGVGTVVELKYVNLQTVSKLKLKLKKDSSTGSSGSNNSGSEIFGDTSTPTPEALQLQLEANLNKYATLTQGTIIPITNTSSSSSSTSKGNGNGDNNTISNTDMDHDIQLYEVVELRNSQDQPISSGLIQDNDVTLTIV